MRELLFIILVLTAAFHFGQGKKTKLKGTKWWTLANIGQPSNDLHSNTQLYNSPSLLPLTKRQRRLVTKNPGTILALMAGARMAIEECKYQFRNRRWNCPTMDVGNGGPIFGKILQRGCRETSFIYAITSAAVTHSIARACSEGSVYTCTCDYQLKKPRGTKNWEWGGCSDNANFGHKFSRKFVDVLEKGRDFRYMMNLHNNEAGRVHVSKNMELECKCHGMSGSCTIKTCWMRLPTFRKVGLLLKDRFDGASKVVSANNGGGRKKRRRRFKFVPTNPNLKKPGRRDLVYFEQSPTFCDRDDSIGFPGTKGRECNATSIGIDGCDLMCCGRGFNSESYTVRERCSCIFQWCCHVKCETCTRTKIRHTCL
ncbi:protein Wnt-1-like isoform X2 [Mizuhopecten yessoensis]|uniref:Protein Wnt n=1 Tax=Mizuhopecten yessoensis TaxID=6573 RepID=A0A210R2Y6_MIZYE|nr:protein Wnt-1-like isoform X2 [Mizuhopecten yessoensis]OWF55276.1 Protein Wnt-1 [Mizuhopecten yessoensis]